MERRILIWRSHVLFWREARLLARGRPTSPDCQEAGQDQEADTETARRSYRLPDQMSASVETSVVVWPYFTVWGAGESKVTEETTWVKPCVAREVVIIPVGEVVETPPWLL
jgi:hypothetical protein